ncbi:hypothetical protein [Rhizobium sp. AC44/96]|nr:hypothetical protein [Rhizobium sp. AC44/96]
MLEKHKTDAYIACSSANPSASALRSDYADFRLLSDSALPAC